MSYHREHNKQALHHGEACSIVFYIMDAFLIKQDITSMFFYKKKRMQCNTLLFSCFTRRNNSQIMCMWTERGSWDWPIDLWMSDCFLWMCNVVDLYNIDLEQCAGNYWHRRAWDHKLWLTTRNLFHAQKCLFNYLSIYASWMNLCSKGS